MKVIVYNRIERGDNMKNFKEVEIETVEEEEIIGCPI